MARLTERQKALVAWMAPRDVYLVRSPGLTGRFRAPPSWSMKRRDRMAARSPEELEPLGVSASGLLKRDLLVEDASLSETGTFASSRHRYYRPAPEALQAAGVNG